MIDPQAQVVAQSNPTTTPIIGQVLLKDDVYGLDQGSVPGSDHEYTKKRVGYKPSACRKRGGDLTELTAGALRVSVSIIALFLSMEAAHEL
jgi:hypothetical protein